jgi:hypothetical protein
VLVARAVRDLRGDGGGRDVDAMPQIPERPERTLERVVVERRGCNVEEVEKGHDSILAGFERMF